MSRKYTLSFCILTCNQPDKLSRLLESLINQNLESVEIIIRDDSNNTKSKVIVESYLSRINIKYYHLKADGIDRAIQYVVKKARGQYVWMFGDDVLAPNAFEKVKTQIDNSKDLDFLYLNSSNFDRDQLGIQEFNDIATTDKDKFLMLIKDQLGFISALIFRANIVKDASIKDETSVGTHWLILYCSFFAIVNGSRFLYLADIFFFSDDKPAGEVRWYDSYQVHSVRFSQEAIKFSNNFSPGVIRNLIRFKFHISWKAVVVERALGLNTGFASHTPKILQTLKTFWSYPDCYIAIFLFMLPRKILSIAYRFYLSKLRK